MYYLWFVFYCCCGPVRAFVQWKTDQSNEDWGWKFTAVADVGKVKVLSWSPS